MHCLHLWVFVVLSFTISLLGSNNVCENINAVLITEVQFSFHSHSMSGSLSPFSLLQLFFFFFFGIILISCIGTGNFILQQTGMLTNPNLKLFLNQPYRAHAILNKIRSSPFSRMINLHIFKYILGLPSDELIIYLCGNIGYWFCYVGRALPKMQITGPLVSKFIWYPRAITSPKALDRNAQMSQM